MKHYIATFRSVFFFLSWISANFIKRGSDGAVTRCCCAGLIFHYPKRCSYLKNAALDFVLLVLKLCPIQVVILLPLWIKLTMGLLLLYFLCNFSSFLALYVGRILLSNHFLLLLIDRHIFVIQHCVIHEEHLRYSLWSVAILWTTSEALMPWSRQQKVVKTTSKSLSLSNSSQKSPNFTVLMYALYGHPRYFGPNISSSSKNINSTAGVSKLSFRFLWLWCLLMVSLPFTLESVNFI